MTALTESLTILVEHQITRPSAPSRGDLRRSLVRTSRQSARDPGRGVCPRSVRRELRLTDCGCAPRREHAAEAEDAMPDEPAAPEPHHYSVGACGVFRGRIYTQRQREDHANQTAHGIVKGISHSHVHSSGDARRQEAPMTVAGRLRARPGYHGRTTDESQGSGAADFDRSIRHDGS